MFDYMTVQEAATKWGISERRIQKLCRGKPHTRCCTIEPGVADTKGRGKAR